MTAGLLTDASPSGFASKMSEEFNTGFMNMSAKPFPLHKVVAYGLATIVAFALLSFFFLFLQVRSGIDRIAGEVVQITSDTITIVDAGGEMTTLLIPDNVILKGVANLDEISVGQQIMSGGKLDDEGQLEVQRLRVFGE